MSTKLFSSDDRLLVHHVKNLLESASIACSLKNDMMYTLAGEVPVFEVMPEVWVENTNQLPEAEKILNSLLENTSDNHGKAWQCPQCGEKHDAHFVQCWNCGYQQSDE